MGNKKKGKKKKVEPLISYESLKVDERLASELCLEIEQTKKSKKIIPAEVHHSKFNPFEFILQPGECSAEEIAYFFLEINKLYQMIGGTELEFSITEGLELVHDGVLV